jgi:hypothetical protein
MYNTPAIPKTGKEASKTKVMSQPVTNANTKPDIKVPKVMIKVDIFYPIAP